MHALGRGAANDAARERALRALDDPDVDVAVEAGVGLASAALDGRWRPSREQVDRLAEALGRARSDDTSHGDLDAHLLRRRLVELLRK